MVKQVVLLSLCPESQDLDPCQCVRYHPGVPSTVSTRSDPFSATVSDHSFLSPDQLPKICLPLAPDSGTGFQKHEEHILMGHTHTLVLVDLGRNVGLQVGDFIVYVVSDNRMRHHDFRVS